MRISMIPIFQHIYLTQQKEARGLRGVLGGPTPGLRLSQQATSITINAAEPKVSCSSSAYILYVFQCMRYNMVIHPPRETTSLIEINTAPTTIVPGAPAYLSPAPDLGRHPRMACHASPRKRPSSLANLQFT